MHRSALLDARSELSQAIRASEEWQPSYKRHPETFSALLRHEAGLERQVAEYLAGLAQTATQYVDWSLVPDPIKAASNPLANKTDDVWKGEAVDFTKAVIDAITQLTVTGAQFGVLEYGIPFEATPLTEWALTAAGGHTAGLVSGVTDTNRKLIQQAIKQGIKEGEDVAAMTERIGRYIASPVRAEMIAQTESVNAYQSGLLNSGIETGVKTKTWESLAAACVVCAPLDGKP